MYRVIRAAGDDYSANAGVDPSEEIAAVYRGMARHGHCTSRALVSALVAGHYAYLFSRGLLRPDWEYGFPDAQPLLDVDGHPLPVEWVSLPRTSHDPIWTELQTICRDTRTIYHRQFREPSPHYERLYVGDTGLAVWVVGVLPYSDPENVLGVYQLAKAALRDNLGDLVPVQENPSVGLEEVPWIMAHWPELGPGRPPLARIVAAALEAQ